MSSTPRYIGSRSNNRTCSLVCFVALLASKCGRAIRWPRYPSVVARIVARLHPSKTHAVRFGFAGSGTDCDGASAIPADDGAMGFSESGSSDCAG